MLNFKNKDENTIGYDGNYFLRTKNDFKEIFGKRFNTRWNLVFVQGV